MPEENGNGKNGNRVGLLERGKAGVKEDVQSLQTDMPAKAKEQIEGLKDPTKTQVYTSIFRHKHDDTPRNRALGVLSNVFLHLHLGHGRNHVLLIYCAHVHRRSADVLLPSQQSAGFSRRSLS